MDGSFDGGDDVTCERLEDGIQALDGIRNHKDPKDCVALLNKVIRDPSCTPGWRRHLSDVERKTGRHWAA